MTTKDPERDSALIPVLRESIGIVQMILFKELKGLLAISYTDKDGTFHNKLAGAITNRIFGVENPEPRFQEFNRAKQGNIEQELFGLPEQLPELMGILTDALRVMVLCDTQEGEDTSSVLITAQQLGLLIVDRETPLPSTFMTRVRRLGERHGLTIAPVENLGEMNGSGPH